MPTYVTPQKRRYTTMQRRGATSIQRAWRLRQYRQRQVKTFRGIRRYRATYVKRAYPKLSYKSRLEKSASSLSQVSSDLVHFGAMNKKRIGTLNLDYLPWPQPTGLGVAADQGREGRSVMIKGIKLYRHFSYGTDSGNISPTQPDVGTIVVNWALLQAKSNVSTTTITANITNDFFSCPSLPGRASTFVSYASNSLWDSGMNLLAVNPNNGVNVLMHKRKMLEPRSGGRSNMKENNWIIKKYIPINRVFSYDSNANPVPNQTIFEVYWYNTIGADKLPGTTLDLCEPLETHTYHQVYFSEPQN